ncbi:MAG: hypothetical protein J1E64_07935, partial [Acetatifactor sp.]|nr:hypothetical protein [Acetatifactor sp.]
MKGHCNLRNWKRVLAFLLSFAMLATYAPIVALADEADDGGGVVAALDDDEGVVATAAGGKEYVLDAGTLDTFSGTKQDGETTDAGDDNYFTLIWLAKSQVDDNSKTFDGNVSVSKRINFQTKAALSGGSIQFTTGGAATVKIWWVAGGDGREMIILDSAGKEAKKTSEGSTKNVQYISTLTLDDAGTYYLGGDTGNNYIYRVAVTETGDGSGSGDGKPGTLKPPSIGDGESYDFVEKKNLFGAGTQIAANTPILSPKGYIQIEGKYGNFPLQYNAGGHGLLIDHNATITVKVPGNSQGVITASGCQHNTAGFTATESSQGTSVSLGGTACADKITLAEYTNKTGNPVTVEINIVGNGQCYFHNITYSVSEILEEITVAGNVGTQVAGSTLIFTDPSGKQTTCTVNSDGSYSVQLAIGKAYTVTLNNNNGWKLVNATLDLTNASAGQNLSGKNFAPVCWKSDKSFAVTIGGTKFTVTPGSAEGEKFTVKAESGDGHVELTTPNTALIWANLQGSGQGSLMKGMVTTDGTVDTSISGNTLTVTYKDQSTLPSSYILEVKDNSASGTPYKTGKVQRYDFTDGSVISALYDGNTGYYLTGGQSVTSTDKLVTLTGNNKIYKHNSTHGIVIAQNDTIKVTVAGNATITFSACNSSQEGSTISATSDSGGTITPTSSNFKVSGDGSDITFNYVGEKAVLTFTIGGAAGQNYLHSLSVVNEAEATTTNPNAATVVPSAERVGNKNNLTITPAGQSLTLVQNGGKINQKNEGKADNSFYLFPETADFNTLEFDVVVNTATSADTNGIWVGAFDGNQYMMTVMARKGTELKQYYTKKDNPNTNNGTGGTLSATVPFGTSMHYKMYKKSSDSKFYIEVTYPKDGGELVTETISFDSGKDDYKLLKGGIGTPVYYGIAVSNASATITNMVYTDKDGKVLYDQNTYYNPIGVAPVPTGVYAEVGSTKEYIDVSWTGDACVGDGKYVLEVSRDNKNWQRAAINLTTKTYRYLVSSEDSGKFYFRVTGVLGMNVLPATNAKYVTSEMVEITAALTRPVIELSTGTSSVTVSWKAVSGASSYKVYRYSFDEGEANAKVIADNVTTTSYTDKTAEEEMPYYYYVTAHSSNNFSNPSNTEWAFLTSGHSGEYVYEDESAGITITSKSYDTVFNGKITLEGIIEKAGSVSLLVNGTEAAKQDNVSARGTFSFKDIDIQQGRNDVNLIVTDANGKKTRKTFNFVYLTNYDKVVDATFTGTDGEKVNNISTYKTVQAAVNSVASSSERVVILVKEGSYHEHLKVNTPNITLIGEDSEKTNIHFYDEKESPRGGNMGVRCAIYIQSGATGFSAENLTFENDYAYKGDGTIPNESADALQNDAENTVYVNVRFLGYQDTLCANKGKQYYYKCYILGNVDFVYGNEPRAYFKDCELVFRSAPAKNSGYVAAPKASANASYGLTFYDCHILSEAGCSGSGYMLARPWGPDAYVTWINCYMGKILRPNTGKPYAAMSGNTPELARFYECGSYGPGFAVNVNRRQISKAKANEMQTVAYLGWDPGKNTGDIGEKYKGSIVTETNDKLVSNEYNPDTYLETEGDDTGLGKYRMEGFAQAAGVTGGGLLHEKQTDNGKKSDNYYKVANAEEFLTALVKVKTSGMPSVIELTGDINLGPKEVANYASYSSVIVAHGHQPLTHPTLLQTGMSKLSIKNMGNLTIYSSNGSSIKHACIDIYNSSNIIIRNIAFDECWEWDEDTAGDYDTNDWDYVTIEKGSADIWIDHCTFYKAYDGVIDSKTPVANSNTTISWCEFLPGSEGNVFFNAMMNELKANPSKYPYYQSLLDSGMSEEQIYGYAYGQKKTHLYGQSVEATDAKNLTLTLANNYYYNSMDRMPRIRYGTAHVYNCVMNAQELRDTRKGIANEKEAKRIVSNGASSTCGAHVLLENSVISGITNALNSGNGSDPAGYINAVNTLYYMDGTRYKLEPKVNTTLEGEKVLLQDPDEFTSALPYSNYALYDPMKLQTEVIPYVGAGKMNWTVLQWEKTAYYDPTWTEPDDIPNYDDDNVPDYTENASDKTNSDDDDDDDDDRTLQEEAVEGKAEAIEKDAKGKEVRRLTNRNMQHVISIVGGTKILPAGAYYTSQYQTGGSHYDKAVAAVKSKLVECSDFRVIDINLYDANNVAIHRLGGMVNVEIRMPDGFKVRDGYVIVVYRLNDN